MTIKIRELRIKADFTRDSVPTVATPGSMGQADDSVAQRNMASRNTERAKSKKNSRER